VRVFISIEQLIELLFLFQHPKKAQKGQKSTTICWIGPFRGDGQNSPTQRFIANRYETTEANLSRWLKKHGMR